MPLPHPHPRELAHTRHIECCGYLRDDGLWDIEAHLTDTKPRPIPNKDRGGTIEPGEYLHDIWMRVTLDKTLKVMEVEACIDSGPYAICPRIAPNYKRLIGERIDRGWSKLIHRLVGRTEGCTHLSDMLKVVAVTAFQTILAPRFGTAEKPEDDRYRKPPPHLDTCHSLATDGPIVRRDFPKWYKGDTPPS